MYGSGTKKMIALCILEILKENSDSDHRLKQYDILRLLEEKYNLSCERKSIKSNLQLLLEMGYDIDCTEKIRINKEGEEEVVATDWYYNHTFDSSELRILIDSILFSKNVSTNQARELIEKIEHLSNKYFKSKVRHVSNLPDMQHSDNVQVLYNLEVIDEAIEKCRKISFVYNKYDVDKELHPTREKKFIVNPYQIVANTGKFYLVCNYDKYDDISHYRLDRMTDVEVTEQKIKSMKKLKGMENGFDLPKHMAEHIYMFSGPTSYIKFFIDRKMISEVVDWFGKDFSIFDEDKERILIRLKCNEDAMFFWSMQYGRFVEVVEPKRLRMKIVNTIEEMKKKYKDKEH